jgi:predicted signal transduction protein with EAL and GGDEF domain
LLERIERHPLARALRADKLTLAALEATLRLYAEGRAAEVPAVARMAEPEASVRARAEALRAELAARAPGLRAEVREGDLCCRIGGEEFALLMPGIGRQEGEAAFNRMGAAVRMPMLLEGAERCITISGGIATLSGSDIRPEEILRLADRALYDAKRNGRDRVVVAA